MLVDMKDLLAKPEKPKEAVVVSPCCKAERKVYRHSVLDIDPNTAEDTVRTASVLICAKCRKPIGEKGLREWKNLSRVQNAIPKSQSPLPITVPQEPFPPSMNLGAPPIRRNGIGQRVRSLVARMRGVFSARTMLAGERN